ncbi:MAG TPA: hypothetical protein PKX99_06750, partial [Thermoanaerobaculia bacterium]|nr:hypothetical protein [Thermoanaerobaculia bacterium]
PHRLRRVAQFLVPFQQTRLVPRPPDALLRAKHQVLDVVVLPEQVRLVLARQQRERERLRGGWSGAVTELPWLPLPRGAVLAHALAERLAAAPEAPA